MTTYDSIERGGADECEPLRGRLPRTFTLTQLLVACVAVCGCTLAATTVVNTHLANFDDDSALANFDLGSALANFDDDYPEGAQLGGRERRPRTLSDHVRCVKALRQRLHGLKKQKYTETDSEIRRLYDLSLIHI